MSRFWLDSGTATDDGDATVDEDDERNGDDGDVEERLPKFSGGFPSTV